jgi:hypothetical protein
MTIESQQPPTRVILEQASPWSRWFARAGWIVAGIALLSAVGSAGAFSRYFQRDSRVVEKWHSLSKTAAAKVAVVRLLIWVVFKATTKSVVSPATVAVARLPS